MWVWVRTHTLEEEVWVWVWVRRVRELWLAPCLRSLTVVCALRRARRELQQGAEHVGAWEEETEPGMGVSAWGFSRGWLLGEPTSMAVLSCAHAPMRPCSAPDVITAYERIYPRVPSVGGPRRWSETGSDYVSTRDSFTSLEDLNE